MNEFSFLLFKEEEFVSSANRSDPFALLTPVEGCDEGTVAVEFLHLLCVVLAVLLNRIEINSVIVRPNSEPVTIRGVAHAFDPFGLVFLRICFKFLFNDVVESSLFSSIYVRPVDLSN
jgi:hypothetical protein